jgi:hypothetical protein
VTNAVATGSENVRIRHRNRRDRAGDRAHGIFGDV